MRHHSTTLSTQTLGSSSRDLHCRIPGALRAVLSVTQANIRSNSATPLLRTSSSCRSNSLPSLVPRHALDSQEVLVVSPSPSITLQRLSIFFAFSCGVANVLACDRNKKSSEIPTLAPPVREQKEGVGSCEQLGSEDSTKRSTLETFRGSNIYVTTQNGCHRHKGIQQFSLNQFEDVLAEGLEENNCWQD